MTVTDVLVKQTQEAHSWTNKLIASIPQDLWDETPDNLASNISWQVGHLIISEYYHAILVISGFDAEITEKIDLHWHNKMYGYNSVPLEQVGSVSPKVLLEQLHYMHHKVLKNISGLTLADLDNPVERPIKQKHPVAITKFDAVSWNIKHTMWHCGQMATLKRLIHGGYDYGL
jgi:hypothetical protein